MGLRAAALACSAALCALLPSGALADDEELVLMDEPTTFTDVVDAFDEHDVFDLDITIGYLRTWELGRVQREQAGPDAGDGRMSRNWQDVADYSRERNQLVFGLDVGIYRDIAVYARLPLILSDDRSLARIGGEDPGALVYDRTPAGQSMMNPPLFDVPAGRGFRSPTRSGIDYLAAGIAWSILNQHRDPHVPTWVLMIEGRFNIGTPMRACQNDDGTVRCQGGGTDPGVSRGTNALRIETRSSFRYQYIEPYAGLAFQMEWPGASDRFFVPGGNLAGYINARPPIVGRLTVGTAIIPWEDRQQWQRFSVDLRFTGDYVSEGRDYSPLFDALGSSSNPYLTSPNCEGVFSAEDGSCAGAGLVESAFFGLTDTQSHLRIGGQITLEMQAARYVRFGVSTAVYHSPSYVITQADACNPNADPPGGDERTRGTCRSGIINPHHRPAIDLPGQRFRMESLTQVDVAASVTAQF
ncbi:MAG: hypothetical protein M3Y87_16225 [Myxococcota bacterium]|nr:hypothetical protein [Myxococcota bacterium]